MTKLRLGDNHRLSTVLAGGLAEFDLGLVFLDSSNYSIDLVKALV